MKQVAKEIFREKLFAESSAMTHVYVYLFRAKPRSLLIDAGYNVPSSRAAILAMLKELEIPLTELDVFITHNHPDHAGGAYFLQQYGARILMAEPETRTDVMLCSYYTEPRDKALLRLQQHGFSLFQGERILQNAFTPPYAYHDYPRAFPFTPISAGETLTYGDYTLETVSLPGHTGGQLGLAEKHWKWLFVGDTISRNEVLIVSATNDRENLLEQQRQTFAMLEQTYRRYWMVGGHFNPFFGCENSIHNALRYYENLRDRAERTVSREGSWISAAKLLEKIFRYRTPMELEEPIKLHFRLANLMACLNDLTAQGRIQHKVQDGVWLWRK